LDCRLEIADWRLPIGDCRLEIADWRLRVCLQSQIGNQKSAIANAAMPVIVTFQELC